MCIRDRYTSEFHENILGFCNNIYNSEGGAHITGSVSYTHLAIDTAIKYDGKEYIFIDTAGLRRKNKIKADIERYSIIRAVSAVERADVVIVDVYKRQIK